MFNLYLEIFRSGLAAALPTASLLGNPSFPRQYYATDTNGFYIFNPATVAWELQYQLKPTAFASLPATNRIIGTEVVVNDATTPTKGGIIAGGGAVITGAVWDGTNWRGL